MARIAYDPTRTTRYAVVGSTAPETVGAAFVDGQEAHRLAKAGMLRCADPHCEAALVYRQTADGSRAPHWAHPPGSRSECADPATPDGRWHQEIQYDLLGRALAHEASVPGARVDAVVRRTGSPKVTGIEVQHSPIRPETVASRHYAHHEAGLTTTLWIINGVRAVPGTPADEWTDPACEKPASRGVEGHHGTVIREGWVIDLLRQCADDGRTGPGRCTVGVLVTTAQGHVLRIADTVLFACDPTDGARVAVVTKWTDPVPEHVLREWAAGPDRMFGQDEEPTMRVLDMAPERVVKTEKRTYAASLNSAGTRVSILCPGRCFPGQAFFDAAIAAGLTWVSGSFAHRDGTSTTAGRFIGDWTDASRALLTEWGLRPVASANAVA